MYDIPVLLIRKLPIKLDSCDQMWNAIERFSYEWETDGTVL